MKISWYLQHYVKGEVKETFLADTEGQLPRVDDAVYVRVLPTLEISTLFTNQPCVCRVVRAYHSLQINPEYSVDMSSKSCGQVILEKVE